MARPRLDPSEKLVPVRVCLLPSTIADLKGEGDERKLGAIIRGILEAREARRARSRDPSVRKEGRERSREARTGEKTRGDPSVSDVPPDASLGKAPEGTPNEAV